ncbi:MAG: HAMP domain-containing histidine kinase [Planctomycetes bacterium]|nr:HAMP domain-containing histidine kinase [Planctomycetota bacterium]
MLDQDWHLPDIKKALGLFDSGRLDEGVALLTAGMDRAIKAKDRNAALAYDVVLALMRSEHRPFFDLVEQARERKIKLDAWRSLSARSAHRIGNQLFASLGALRTLRGLDAPEAVEAVADIEASLERVGTIVKEFQRFSVNEEPALLPTDLRPLLGDLVRRYQRVARNVEVAIEAPESLPHCQVDRNQIDQAFGELLENALHHTPPGGKVVVKASAMDSGKGVLVAVEDTGPGVPAENKERLFEAFFSTRPGGSGLGLAIVRQIIENHGGRIRETGTPGKGARFEVELPAAPKQETNP